MKSEKRSKGAEMSEAMRATACFDDIAFPARLNGVSRKGQVTFVHRKLDRQHPQSGWTWRRVKAFAYGEVENRNVRARELRELEETAALLREARKAHAEFIAETERLAAAFAHQDEDFAGPEIEARRSLACGMDRSGTEGDDQ